MSRKSGNRFCEKDMLKLKEIETSAGLVLPLDRASHGRRLILRAVAGLRHLLHRLEKVAAGIRDQGRARGIEPAAILQLVRGIEAEEVGSALRAVGSGHLLGRVDHVGEGEAVLRRKR